MKTRQSAQSDVPSELKEAAQGNAYSEVERTRFREEFRLQMARFTRLRRVMGIGLIAFFAFAISCFALGGMAATRGAAQATIPLASLSFIVVLVALYRSRRLHCPACRHRLIDRFGPWCPECGKRALGLPDPCDINYVHPCAVCGRKLRWGKGAKIFRLRYCTHCGLLLDEQGLTLP